MATTRTSGYKKKRDQYMIGVVGSNIRKYRKANGLSIHALAVLCEVESKQINNYELGKVEISVSMVSIISKKLGLQPHQLLIP